MVEKSGIVRFCIAPKCHEKPLPNERLCRIHYLRKVYRNIQEAKKLDAEVKRVFGGGNQ